MSNAARAFLDPPIASAAADRPAMITAPEPRPIASWRSWPPAPALLLPDGLEWAAVFFEALRLGVVAVLLNTHLEPAV